MTVRGQTKDVAINPVTVKDVDPKEAFVPVHTDIRNMRLSDVGNLYKRYGYGEKWNTAVNDPIDLLIPQDNGYAIHKNNRLFYLNDTPTELSGVKLTGEHRPTWATFDTAARDFLIVCDGGVPVYLTNMTSTALGGNTPSGARYVSLLGDRLIMSGFVQADTGHVIQVSDPGDPESWSILKSIIRNGLTVKNQITHEERVWFFTENSIEVWNEAGSVLTIARNEGISTFNLGLLASDSVVMANGRVYFLGKGPDFYVMKDFRPSVISTLYSKELKNLVNPESVYGFDFRNERCIKWIAPIDGRCFIYDYQNEIFFEDNIWEHAQYGRMPINSHMRLNEIEYFGTYNHTGKVHENSADYTDDDGIPIRTTRKFLVPLSASNRSGRISKVGFRLKRGVATATVTDPKFAYKYRVDGGNSGQWKHREASLGLQGDYHNWIYHKNLGVGEEIEFDIYAADEVDFILTNMNMTVKRLGR